MSRVEEYYKSTLQRLVTETESLKKRVRRLEADIPLFDVSNEFSPTALAGTSNNYDPGNYDVLRLTMTQDSAITGILGGKKGRYLELYNASAYKLTLPNEGSASSATARVVTPSGQDVVVFPSARAKLYYDIGAQRWVVPDLPQWAGRYGIGIFAFKTPLGIALQSIPDIVGAQLQINRVVIDDWGLFDAANFRVVIPAGLGGLWLGSLTGYWDPDVVGGNWRQINWHINGYAQTALTVPSVAGKDHWMTAQLNYPLAAGDVVTWHAYQISGAPLNFRIPAVLLVKIR